MQGIEPEQLAKWLIGVGLAIVFVGIVMFGLGKLSFFRLPGDLSFEGKNWRFFLPITTCVLLSLSLTGILWLIHFFSRK
jgi:uncharacterized membrane protein YqjE